MKMKDVKIVMKLQLGFAVLLLFVFVLGIISYFQTSMIYQQTEDLYDHPVQVTRAVAKLNEDILHMRLGTRNLMLSVNEEEQQEAVAYMEVYGADALIQFDLIRERYLGPKENVEEAYNAYFAWKTAREENTKLAIAGNIKSIKESVSNSGMVGKLRDDMLEKVMVIEVYAKAKTDSLFAKASSLKRMLNMELIFLVSFMILLSGLIIIQLLKAVHRPINDLMQSTNRFREGDLDARCSYRSKDEFGALSESFNTMVESVQKRSELDKKVADLSALMVVDYDMKRFFRMAVTALAEQTDSQMAAIYLLSEDKKSYYCFESVGLDEQARQSFDAETREGEFGVALTTKNVHLLTNIPQDTRFAFKTVSGRFIPSDILTIPVNTENEVIAMISLASLTPYNEQVLALINRVLVTLSTRIEGLLAYQKKKEFMTKLEAQNSELEAQKRELSAQSEQLIEQNRELEIQKLQLGEANRLKTSFLSNMSHELRTPLNSVIALSGVLSRRLSQKISDEESSFLEVIERNGKHLLHLINDILDISRIEAGREEVEISTFKPCAVVHDLIEMIRPQVMNKGVELKVEKDDCDVTISSDMDKFRHIMQNLIGNAAKFTEKGTVTVSAELHEKRITIKVKDTGIGISEENLGHVFDEFRQADSSTSRRFGGTGLGLAIAQKYAVLLGGSISVQSTLGVGSVFALEMPLEYMEGASVEAPVAPLELKVENKTPKFQPMIDISEKTILLVEDSEPAIIQLKDFLEEFGCTIMVAHNGEEGLARIEKTIPDAMILDLMMPGIDGFKMLEMLRNAEPTAHVPVLVLTAKQITKEELQVLKKNNIHQLIRKGDVSRSELLNAVAWMLMSKENAAQQPTSSAQPAYLAQPASSHRRPVEGKPMVLVVEDNPDNMVTVNAVLSNDYIVLEAIDGKSGVEMARKYLPHLILMDIALPDIDGITAFKMIREDVRMQGIPVIALTASAMLCERESILAHGFDTFLAKPIEEKLFLKTINEMLYGK